MKPLQLERNNPLSLYEQLKNIIAAKIKSGEYQPDQQIPSERELCEQFDVSRITVRQAISLAINEGLLYRTHGRGTFVQKPKIKQGLEKVSSFQQTLAQQGLIASTKRLKHQTIASNFHLSKLLNVSMMEQIFNIGLLGLGNEDAVVYYDNYFPYDIGVKLDEQATLALERTRPFSTLDLYGEHIGLVPTHAEQSFEATVADEWLSSVLQVNPGAPILLVSSIVYMGNQPIEYKQAYYRGDKYKFFINREFDAGIFQRRRILDGSR